MNLTLNKDYVFHALAFNSEYYWRMANCSNLVNDAISKHNLTVDSAQKLAEGILANILIASILVENERVNLRFQFGKDTATMGVETGTNGATKGYLETQTPVLGETLNFDSITIRSLRISDKVSSLYEGISKYIGHSIEEAINDHIIQSYQMRAKIKLDVWLNNEGKYNAFGIVFCELPEISEKTEYEVWPRFLALPKLSELFLSANGDPDTIANSIAPHKFQALKSINPFWQCTCSRENMKKVLSTLKEEDRVSPVEIKCHYCNTTYTF